MVSARTDATPPATKEQHRRHQNPRCRRQLQRWRRRCRHLPPTAPATCNTSPVKTPAARPASAAAPAVFLPGILKDASKTMTGRPHCPARCHADRTDGGSAMGLLVVAVAVGALMVSRSVCSVSDAPTKSSSRRPTPCARRRLTAPKRVRCTSTSPQCGIGRRPPPHRGVWTTAPHREAPTASIRAPTP